jgi:hypothetical protein
MSATEVAEAPEAHKRLTKALKGKHHLFATGDKEIQEAALAAAQQIFDSGKWTSEKNICFGSC